MIKGGVKNESDFSPLFILSLKTLSFSFFSFTKFVVKIKFLSQFSVLANFIENIMKILFICKQGHGEEEVSISVIYIHIYSCFIFSLIVYGKA